MKAPISVCEHKWKRGEIHFCVQWFFLIEPLRAGWASLTLCQRSFCWSEKRERRMGVALFHPEHPIFGGTARGKNLSTGKYAQMKIRRGSARNRFSCHRLQVKSSWKSPLSQRRAPFPCTRQRGSQRLQCPHWAIRKFYDWDFLKLTFQLFKSWMFLFLIVCYRVFFSIFWN